MSYIDQVNVGGIDSDVRDTGTRNTIAPTEETAYASKAYAKDAFFIWEYSNGKVYQATAAIAKDAQFVVGTNCKLVGDVGDAINAVATSLNSALANEVNARTSAVSSEATTRAAADTALGARIDNIVAPSGEAPSAAEVTDARVGADGTTYNSLGTAVRTQITNLKTSSDTRDDRILKNIKVLKENSYFTNATNPSITTLSGFDIFGAFVLHKGDSVRVRWIASESRSWSVFVKLSSIDVDSATKTRIAAIGNPSATTPDSIYTATEDGEIVAVCIPRDKAICTYEPRVLASLADKNQGCISYDPGEIIVEPEIVNKTIKPGTYELQNDSTFGVSQAIPVIKGQSITSHFRCGSGSVALCIFETKAIDATKVLQSVTGAGETDYNITVKESGYLRISYRINNGISFSLDKKQGIIARDEVGLYSPFDGERFLDINYDNDILGNPQVLHKNLNPNTNAGKYVNTHGVVASSSGSTSICKIEVKAGDELSFVTNPDGSLSVLTFSPNSINVVVGRTLGTVLLTGTGYESKSYFYKFAQDGFAYVSTGKSTDRFEAYIIRHPHVIKDRIANEDLIDYKLGLGNKYVSLSQKIIKNINNYSGVTQLFSVHGTDGSNLNVVYEHSGATNTLLPQKENTDRQENIKYVDFPMYIPQDKLLITKSEQLDLGVAYENQSIIATTLKPASDNGYNVSEMYHVSVGDILTIRQTCGSGSASYAIYDSNDISTAEVLEYHVGLDNVAFYQYSIKIKYDGYICFSYRAVRGLYVTKHSELTSTLYDGTLYQPFVRRVPAMTIQLLPSDGDNYNDYVNLRAYIAVDSSGDPTTFTIKDGNTVVYTYVFDPSSDITMAYRDIRDGLDGLANYNFKVVFGDIDYSSVSNIVGTKAEGLPFITEFSDNCLTTGNMVKDNYAVFVEVLDNDPFEIECVEKDGVTRLFLEGEPIYRTDFDFDSLTAISTETSNIDFSYEWAYQRGWSKRPVIIGYSGHEFSTQPSVEDYDDMEADPYGTGKGTAIGAVTYAFHAFQAKGWSNISVNEVTNYMVDKNYKLPDKCYFFEEDDLGGREKVNKILSDEDAYLRQLELLKMNNIKMCYALMLNADAELFEKIENGTATEEEKKTLTTQMPNSYVERLRSLIHGYGWGVSIHTFVSPISHPTTARYDDLVDAVRNSIKWVERMLGITPKSYVTDGTGNSSPYFRRVMQMYGMTRVYHDDHPTSSNGRRFTYVSRKGFYYRVSIIDYDY